MTTKFQSMSVEEFQSFLNRLNLLDSWHAAQFLELSPATLRNPKNKYYKFSVKIGQYRFWRREDLEKMLLQNLINQVSRLIKTSDFRDGTDLGDWITEGDIDDMNPEEIAQEWDELPDMERD